MHKLETLLQSTVDKNFDKLEIFVLRNILSVDEELAPWVQLSHYEVGSLRVLAFPPAVEGLQLTYSWLLTGSSRIPTNHLL